MNWRQRNGVWRSGAWTIRTECDPRSRTVLFELYDSTRFVSYFRTPSEAMKQAENIDNSAAQRRAS